LKRNTKFDVFHLLISDWKNILQKENTIYKMYVLGFSGKEKYKV